MKQLIPVRGAAQLARALAVLCLGGCGAMALQDAQSGARVLNDTEVTRRVVPARTHYPGETAVFQFWYPAGPVDVGGSMAGRTLIDGLLIGDEPLSSRLDALGATAETWIEPAAVVLSVTTPVDLADEVLNVVAQAKLASPMEAPQPTPQHADTQRLNRLLNHAYEGGALGTGFADAPIRPEQRAVLESALTFAQASLVIVAPEADVDALAEKLTEAVGLGRITPLKRPASPSNQSGPSVHVERAAGPQGWILAAFPIDVRTAEDAAHADIAIRVLRTYIGQAFNRHALGQLTLSFVYSPATASQFVLEFQCARGREDEAWKTFVQALKSVKNLEAEPRLLNDALQDTRRDLVLQDGQIGGRARRLGALTNRFGAGPHAARYDAALKGQEPDALMRSIMGALKMDRMKALFLLSQSAPTDPTLYGESLTAELREMMASPKGSTSARSIELTDGTRVLIADRPGTGTVAMSARFDGGLSQVPSHLYGAAMMSAMLMEGAVSGSRVRADGDAIYLDWSGPKSEYLRALSAIGDAMRPGEWSSESFEEARLRALNRWRERRSKELPSVLEAGVGISTVAPTIFEDSLRMLTTATLGGWFRAYVSDTSLTVTVVGEVTVDEAVARARRTLATSRPRRTIRSRSRRAASTNTSLNFRAVGSDGGAVFSIRALSPEEQEAMRVLAGMLDARFRRNAGSRVHFIERHGAVHMYVTGSEGADLVRTALTGIRETSIAHEELYQARRRAVAHQVLFLGDNAHMAHWLVQQVTSKSGWVGKRALRSWRAVAEGITAKDLGRLVKKVFNQVSVSSTTQPLGDGAMKEAP